MGVLEQFVLIAGLIFFCQAAAQQSGWKWNDGDFWPTRLWWLASCMSMFGALLLLARLLLALTGQATGMED